MISLLSNFNHCTAFYNSQEDILYILDESHTKIIFIQDFNKREIVLPLKNKVLSGEDFNRFYWFNRYVYGQPVEIATIPLNKLNSKF